MGLKERPDATGVASPPLCILVVSSSIVALIPSILSIVSLIPSILLAMSTLILSNLAMSLLKRGAPRISWGAGLAGHSVRTAGGGQASTGAKPPIVVRVGKEVDMIDGGDDFNGGLGVGREPLLA